MIDQENPVEAYPVSPSRQARLVYLVIAWLALLLGLAGALLPLLPATPFLLVAVWAASRGSPRVHDWIYRQPRIARLLDDWQQQGAVPLGARLLATLMMIASLSVLVVTAAHGAILLALGLFFLVIGGFLWTRPYPKRPPK